MHDRINEILNNDIEIPQSVLRKKEMAFNQIKINKSKKIMRRRKVIAAVAVMCVAGWAAFGNTAMAAISGKLFHNNPGVQNAVDNGYMQELDENTMSSNGIQISVNNVVKDSRMVGLSLKFKFDDVDLVKHLYAIKFNAAILDDEGNELPLCYNNDNYDINKESGEVSTDILLESHGMQEDEYPLKDINSLNFKITYIDLIAEAEEDINPSDLEEVDDYTKEKFENAGFKLIKTIEGDWNTAIKLDDKFKDTAPIEYKTLEENKLINISSVEVLPTATVVKFNYKDEIAEEDIDELYNPDALVIVDDSGKIYNSTNLLVQHSDKDGGSSYTKSIYFTSFDEANDIKLIFKDSKGKTQEVPLTKVQ